MNNTLVYAISARTQPSAKILKSILDSQAEVNRNVSWSHDRLALVPERGPQNAPFAFPMVRFSLGETRPLVQGFDTREPRKIPDAAACGSTNVRDNLWNAHLVAAFLRFVSAKHPELLFELRNEGGGFVIPRAVWIRAGKVELNRELLNRERERVLEATGDPNAAGPMVWAESEALQGHFFADGPVSEYAEVEEIEALGISWERLSSMTLEEVADRVIERIGALTPVLA